MKRHAFPALCILGLALPTLAYGAATDYPDCGSAAVGVQCVETRAEVGPWQVAEVVPRVGSQNSILMSSPSFQTLPGLFGRTEPAELLLSCIDNTTRIEVRFGENFMSDVGEFGTLIYKIDDQTPVALEAVASDDNTSLGLYAGAEAIPLIRTLFGGERLLVSATSFTGRIMDASFSIEALDTAVEPLRDLCNW